MKTIIQARRGKKTIEVKVRFWTDEIAGNKSGTQTPLEAWDYGTVYVAANEEHGIKSGKAQHFDSLNELLPAIERALKAAKVNLNLHK